MRARQVQGDGWMQCSRCSRRWPRDALHGRTYVPRVRSATLHVISDMARGHVAGVGHVLLVRQHEQGAVLQLRLLPAAFDALALAAAAAVEEEYEGGAVMQGGG
jgi:hypothetical protein